MKQVRENELKITLTPQSSQRANISSLHARYIKLERALDNGVFVHPALAPFVHGRLTRRTTDIGRRRPRLRPAVN